jgi:hypothetical protein
VSDAEPHPSAPARVTAADDPDGHPRTTRALVAALLGRLTTLGFVSGGDAIGSQLAGIAALGREVSATADGARLRESLRRSRSGANGDLVWQALGLDRWLSGQSPSPVVEDLRNDLALLLADDLDEVLEVPGAAGPPSGPVPAPVPVTFLDLMVGLWAWGREVSAAVECAAGRSWQDERVHPAVDEPVSLDGSLLR